MKVSVEVSAVVFGVLLCVAGVALIVSSPLLWHWLSSVLQDWSGLRPVPNKETSFGVAASCFFGGIVQWCGGLVVAVCGADLVWKGRRA